MVSPLPQERRFKQEFERNRLDALRGDFLSVPEADEGSADGASAQATNAFSPLDTPETRRFFAQDSEDLLLQHYPRTEAPTGFAYDQKLDPAHFASTQRQARMSAGIGAPELLPPTVAVLPDPEYSTEDEEVTFGESAAELDRQARAAEDIDAAQNYGNALREKIQQAKQAQMRELERIAKERAKRWLGKIIGNGSNAVDSVGWDGWITFFLSYLYLMARGVVTVLAPESSSSQSPNALHTLLPPYRPLREPGDFLYFIILLFLSCLVILSLISFFLLLATLILFPSLFLSSFLSS